MLATGVSGMADAALAHQERHGLAHRIARNRPAPRDRFGRFATAGAESEEVHPITGSPSAAPKSSRALAPSADVNAVALDGDPSYFSRTAHERWVRVFVGVLTLLFGLAGAMMANSGYHQGAMPLLVLLASVTTIPVAVAWFVGPWPPRRLANAFVLYADLSIVIILSTNEDHFIAMPGCAMFSIVAVYTVVGTSSRVMWMHQALSVALLGTLGALAVRQGSDPWLIAATTVTIGSLYITPLILRTYVRHLHTRAAGAVTDSLTGLLNRRGLLEAAAQISESDLDSADRTVGITVLDIDRFKSINDTFGHPTGDTVLIEIGRRLAGSVPSTSVVARLGGDEFAVVHVGTPESIELSDSIIRTRLDESFAGPPFTVSLGSVSETLIGGVVTPAHVRRLIAQADIELYRHKSERTSTGGDPRVDDAGADDEIRERIDALIAAGGPDIVLQPIRDTATSAIVGYEALSRFPFGHGSPTVWFRQAAHAGKGPDLECAAIDRALAVIDSLPPEVFLSLNASVTTIRSTDLMARLRPHRARRRFHVEITEHERVDDYLAVVRSIEALRTEGVSISVDDVGAGFAGLRQVVELRPDTLKIDLALVHGIADDPIRRAAAAAVIEFAHAVGSAVVMEGIETEAELRVAKELGADMVQGFLIGRPLPAAAVAESRVSN